MFGMNHGQFKKKKKKEKKEPTTMRGYGDWRPLIELWNNFNECKFAHSQKNLKFFLIIKSGILILI